MGTEPINTGPIGSPEPNRLAVLLVRACGFLCAIPVSSVIETMRCPPVTAISGVVNFVIGVAVIRGATAPLVSLGTMLEAAESAGNSGRSANPRSAPDSDRKRLVTLRVGQRVVGLTVDAVVGLREFERSAFSAIPPLLEQAHPGVLSAMVTLDQELVTVLDASHIVEPNLLEQLAQTQ